MREFDVPIISECDDPGTDASFHRINNYRPETVRFNTDREDRNNYRNEALDLANKTNPRILLEEGELQNLRDEVPPCLQNGEFHKAIILLKMLKDHYRDIHTVYFSMKNDKYPLLLRDARLQKRGKLTTEYQRRATHYSYMILGLNYLNGLKDLLAIHNEKDASINLQGAYADLNTLARQYYTNIVPDTDSAKEGLAEKHFGQFYHTVILPYYQQYVPKLSEKEAMENLSLARDFANMKLEPYAVATISRTKVLEELRVGSREFIDTVELELPLLQLTDKQIDMYRNRKVLDWYTGQSEIAKALIDKYTENIIRGRMIPAQLIYHLIGTRNGYEKVTAEINPFNVSRPRETKPFKILNSTYHAGSQAHLLKFVKLRKGMEREVACQEATILSVKQLQRFTEATEAFGITTLVSPIKSIKPKDCKIATQISTAIESIAPEDEVETLYSLLPQNIGRKVVKRILISTQRFLEIANEILDGNKNYSPREHIKTYFANESGVRRPDLRLLQLYRYTEKLKSTMRKVESNLKNIKQNFNLEIGALANLMVHLINAIKGHCCALVSGCLSGQDRSGMLSSHTTTEAIFYALWANKLRIDPGAQQKEIIRNTHARAGHTQEMAGNAGGGWGGAGIKSAGLTVIPTYSETSKKNYITKTAKYNEHIPNKESKLRLKEKYVVPKAKLINSQSDRVSEKAMIKIGLLSNQGGQPGSSVASESDNGFLL